MSTFCVTIHLAKLTRLARLYIRNVLGLSCSFVESGSGSLCYGSRKYICSTLKDIVSEHCKRSPDICRIPRDLRLGLIGHKIITF